MLNDSLKRCQLIMFNPAPVQPCRTDLWSVANPSAKGSRRRLPKLRGNGWPRKIWHFWNTVSYFSAPRRFPSNAGKTDDHETMDWSIIQNRFHSVETAVVLHWMFYTGISTACPYLALMVSKPSFKHAVIPKISQDSTYMRCKLEVEDPRSHQILWGPPRFDQDWPPSVCPLLRPPAPSFFGIGRWTVASVCPAGWANMEMARCTGQRCVSVEAWRNLVNTKSWQCQCWSQVECGF